MTAIVVAFAFAVALPATAVAGTTAGDREEAKLRFTTKAPGAPTGLVLRIDYTNPDDADAKPPAVRKVVTEIARGARYDGAAPQLCEASDLELMLLGPPACPAGSHVGIGRTRIDTGLPPPARFFDVGIDFFHNTGELIYLNQPLPLDSPRVIVRGETTEREVITAPPSLPGTPPDGGAIDMVFVREFVTVRELDGVEHSYVTTPPRCPQRGFWVNRVHVTYYDGVTVTERTRSRCRSAG